ncbi:hypothetical protein R6Q59_016561 [Mikania micrantha]
MNNTGRFGRTHHASSDRTPSSVALPWSSYSASSPDRPALFLRSPPTDRPALFLRSLPTDRPAFFLVQLPPISSRTPRFVNSRYDQPNVSLRNTHVNLGADEDDVEANNTASDEEYMIRLRDEIAERLMENME